MLYTTLKKTYVDKEHESVLCPLCESDKDYLLATKGYPGIPVRNVICKVCGLIRINPRMTRKGYEDFYREDFFEYLNPFNRPAYVDTINRTTDDRFETAFEKNILPYLLPYVKEKAHVLDVGSGFGQVIYLLNKKRGVSYVGIEPDPYSRNIAKEKMNIDLIDITIEDFLKENKETFDLIFLDQVFEHLLQPIEVLKGLRDILSDEGVIYIGVPNSYNPGVSMDRYYELAHTYGYTPAVFKKIADHTGLKITSLRDPLAPALECIFVHKKSSYPEEDFQKMVYGKSWMNVVFRLRRKEFLNTIRGLVKNLLIRFFGENTKEKIRQKIDSLIRYKY